MKDSVVNTLRFFKAKDSEVCWLDAKLDFSESLVGAVDVINDQNVSFRRLLPLLIRIDPVLLACSRLETSPQSQ